MPDDLPIISLESYRIRRGDGYCLHRERHLDDNRRTLTCAKCGAQLDVFDELFRLVRDREQMIYMRKQLTEDIEKLRATHDRLKSDVRNARAQLKRRQYMREKDEP